MGYKNKVVHVGTGLYRVLNNERTIYYYLFSRKFYWKDEKKYHRLRQVNLNDEYPQLNEFGITENQQAKSLQVATKIVEELNTYYCDKGKNPFPNSVRKPREVIYKEKLDEEKSRYGKISFLHLLSEEITHKLDNKLITQEQVDSTKSTFDKWMGIKPSKNTKVKIRKNKITKETIYEVANSQFLINLFTEIRNEIEKENERIESTENPERKIHNTRVLKEQKYRKKHKIKVRRHEKVDIIKPILKPLKAYSVLTRVRKVMNYVFSNCIDENIITSNPLKNHRKVMDVAIPKQIGLKKTLDNRLEGEGLLEYIQVAKKIYKAYNDFSRPRQSKYLDIEMKCFLVTSFMLGRRLEELLKLTEDNITQYNVARINVDDTKTDIFDRYPLPPTFFKMKADFTHNQNKIFSNFGKATVLKYQRLILDRINVPTLGNEQLYGHDKRSLFTLIMGKITGDRELVDRMISHAPKNATKETYQPVDMEWQREVFNVYWDILEGKLDENKVVEAVKKRKFGLGYLYDEINKKT